MYIPIDNLVLINKSASVTSKSYPQENHISLYDYDKIIIPPGIKILGNIHPLNSCAGDIRYKYF